LISELRTRFNPEGWLLTAAVGATRSYHTSSYDVPNMNRYLDYIHVMSYDLHGSWDGVTGQTSPLFRSTSETSDFASQLNVVSIWAQKIIYFFLEKKIDT
jgi:chitinase